MKSTGDKNRNSHKAPDFNGALHLKVVELWKEIDPHVPVRLAIRDPNVGPFAAPTPAGVHVLQGDSRQEPPSPSGSLGREVTLGP